MKQINASFPDCMVEKIKVMAQKVNISFSTTVKELVELGFRVKEAQENQSDKSRIKEIEENSAEYLLRILNLCAEIYRFTFNDHSRVGATDPETALLTIKEQVKKFIHPDASIKQ